MEALKAKLHLAESSAKSFETLASERAHQISSLDRECKVREDRLAAMEDSSSNKDSKIRELETKMAASADRVAALQVEKERLSQQVRLCVGGNLSTTSKLVLHMPPCLVWMP